MLSSKYEVGRLTNLNINRFQLIGGCQSKNRACLGPVFRLNILRINFRRIEKTRLTWAYGRQRPHQLWMLVYDEGLKLIFQASF
jgi:hypothetical protein